MKEKIEMIINEWDPMGLFPGAPLDEYSDEIQQIISALSLNETVSSLSEKINTIFTNSFSPSLFSNREDECREISRKILMK